MALKEVVLADVLQAVFISPNETDSNLEPANIVDALCMLARAVNNLAAAIKDTDCFKNETLIKKGGDSK
jgi:hypothetical protein